MATIILTACYPAFGRSVVVTGKTVYHSYALEDVHIEIKVWEGSRWVYYGEAKSGYHGAFRLHLEPGIYRIEAGKMIRLGSERIKLSGTLEEFSVQDGERRVDQLVIEMKQESVEE